MSCASIKQFLKYVFCCGYCRSKQVENDIPIQATEITDGKQYDLKGNLRYPSAQVTIQPTKTKKQPISFDNPLYGEDEFDIVQARDWQS